MSGNQCAPRPALSPRPDMPLPELIARCVEGNDEARALFVAEYRDIVQRAVLYYLKDFSKTTPVRAEAEDLCHDVFERIFAHQCRRLAELRQPESIHYWLVAIARNQVLGAIRKSNADINVQKQIKSDKEAEKHTTPETIAIANESAACLQNQLNALPTQDRLVLELYYLQSMPYHEIATMTATSIGVVSSRLHRARKKLRKLIENDSGTLLKGHTP